VLAALEGMIVELRQLGVPVSLAERIDAVRCLRHLPLADRAVVRAGLRAVLVKSHDHELAFDTVFDLFFPAPGGVLSPGGGLPPGGGGLPASPSGAAGDGDREAPGGLAFLDDDALADLLLVALREGNELMLQAIAGILVDRYAMIEPGRPVAGTYYAFRTLRAVDLDGLLDRLAEGAAGQSPLRRRLAIEGYEAQLDRFRQAVEAQVRLRLVEDRGAAAVARTLRRPLPEDVDFLTSSGEQITLMRTVLDPLARRLAGGLAEKGRHRHRGTLDFRRTMRASLSTGGVPVRPVFRKPHPAKPELFVLADISGSVATFAAFTLQLMYALRTQFSKVRSFVFADGIDEVTDVLQQAPDVMDVARHINATGSGVWLDGRSDYGHALSLFSQKWGEQVRGRTTVIVLGDARTNYHDPAERALRSVSERAAGLYWLNPEPTTAWDTGDSVIGRYRPYCDEVHECRNIRQLKTFVERLDITR
jgi:uncharacterized protein